jgi:WD40 repeat protein
MLGASRFACSQQRHDHILGLCWLRRSPYRFVTASSKGALRMVDAEPAVAAYEGPDTEYGVALAASGHPPELPVVHSYAPQQSLTCIHVNCDDTLLLASGYTTDVPVFDLPTGRLVRVLARAHSTHINITRFASTIPNLLATSSFDHTVKVRADGRRGGGGLVLASPQPRSCAGVGHEGTRPAVHGRVDPQQRDAVVFAR